MRVKLFDRALNHSMKTANFSGKRFVIFLFFLQRYGPFSLALASLIIDAHSSLSNAFFLHHFTPSFLKSSSTSFIHLSLGRPLPLLPSNSLILLFYYVLILLTCNKNRLEIAEHHKVFGCGYKTLKK